MREFWKQLRFWVTDLFASRKGVVKDPLGDRRATWNDTGPRMGGIANTSIHDPAFKDYIRSDGPPTPPVAPPPPEDS